MVKKKFIIPILVILLVGIIGIVKVNIINTEALSPMGNSDENYALVSKEFGEDFAEFIKDNSEVKIYTGEGAEDASLKFKDKEIQFKKENPFVKGTINVCAKINDMFMVVKGKVEGQINKDNQKTNTELDSTVNDFIEKREKNNSIKDPVNDNNNVDTSNNVGQ